MLKTILLIFCTLVAVAALFAGYWILQPASIEISHHDDPVVPEQSASDGRRMIGEGRGVWVNRSHRETGELLSQFRVDVLEPQRDDTVKVTRPEVRFFLKDDQVLSIRGESGVIVMGAATSAIDPELHGKSEYPKRGDLAEVTIELFASPEAERPELTISLPNVAFDDETSHIFTRAQDGVPADRIPVTMRGEDYDFDGHGLSIRWNEADRRLQVLEVAHGEKLILKNPGALGRFNPSLSTRASAPPLPLWLADADGALPGAIEGMKQETSSPSVRRDRPASRSGANPPIYRAAFNDEVRIERHDQLLASADRLFLDFLMGESNEADAGAERSADPSPPATNHPRDKSTAGKQRPRRATAAEDIEDDIAAAAKSSPPPPLVVRWTGKLTIVPLGNPPALRAGEAVVRMRGNPVTLQRDSGAITCHEVTYITATDEIELSGTARTPIVLVDGQGGRIVGEAMSFSRHDNAATLRGPGRAEIPHRPANPGEPPGEKLSLEWSKRCALRFLPDAGESLAIESATIEGEVHVRHPQIDLKSNRLDLAFAPSSKPSKSSKKDPSISVDLKELAASGEVVCVLTDESRRRQSISANRLNLATAPAGGKFYPRTVVADGDVHAWSDDDRHLYAQELEITLKPSASENADAAEDEKGAVAKSPEVELEALTARRNVQLGAPDGQFAAAEELSVVVQAGRPIVVLRGEPAVIGDPSSKLSGSEIQLDRATETARVIGAGTLHSTHQPTASSPPQPINVSWKQGAVVDAPKNLVTLTGEVTAASTDPDGTVHSTLAQTLLLHLADAEGKPAVDSPEDPATRPTPPAFTAGFDDINTLGDKVVRSIELREEVTVRSILSDAAGQLLRGTDLFASVLEYDVEGKNITVPGAGRLLFRDHRPRDPESKDSDAGRGDTSFEWKDRLTYDPEAGRIVMSRDVAIVHWPDGDKTRESRLDADRVIAEIERRQPSTAPTAQPALASDGLLIQRLLAEGNLSFRHAGILIQGESIEFDPRTGQVIVRGDEQVPVAWLNETNMTQGAAAEIRYNVNTGMMELRDIRGQIRR